MRSKPFLALTIALLAACGSTTTAPPPSNDLLIVGYDREPDTLNRFATHILEDTMICIIEGLTVWDEHIAIVRYREDVFRKGPSPKLILVGRVDLVGSCAQRVPVVLRKGTDPGPE